MKSIVNKIGINAKVVVQSGRKLKSYVSPKTHQKCGCKSCDLGINCKSRNYVYHATCLHCSEIYIGASARPDNEKKGRISEYESSIRLPQQANRTTLGRHKMAKHPNTPLDIKTAYKFKVLDTASDPLETFLKEGLLIQKHRPQINEMALNGYII